MAHRVVLPVHRLGRTHILCLVLLPNLNQVLMYLDKRLGAFMDDLEDRGWLENSIIVVASDNGGCPGDGGSNYPLRGVKQSVFEGGTKVKTMFYLSCECLGGYCGSIVCLFARGSRRDFTCFRVLLFHVLLTIGHTSPGVSSKLP